MPISKQQKYKNNTVNRVKRGYWRKYYRKLKEQIFLKLGDSCKSCGFKDPRALQIDHVNNDGYEGVGIVKGSTVRLRKVLNDTEGRFQILCANCNFIKKYENCMAKWGEIDE